MKRLETIAIAALVALAQPTLAADHRDGPAVVADPAADINDLFAWMSPDTENVNLVMTVFPFAGAGARFSDQVQYVFHTASRPAFGAAGAVAVDVICQFDTAQAIECWVGNQAYVSGDAAGAGGLTSADGQLRVFAGRRNDPFFFNLSGFNATTDIVVGAAGGLTFDGAGCPLLDGATSGLLVNQLASEPDGSPAGDDFLAADTLALVVSVDRRLLTTGGSIVSVWASTNSR